MTRKDARLIIMALFSNYATQISRRTAEDVAIALETYVIGLEDLSVEDARAAVNRAIKTMKWLPNVAELRELVVSTTMTTARKTGAEAWGDVMKAIGKYGRNRVPGVSFEFTDALVARVVDSLGWADLCNDDDAAARASSRKRFIEAYEQMTRNVRTDTQASLGARSVHIPARIGGTTSLGDTTRKLLDAVKPSSDDDDSTKG
jgi:hypothetical protein